MNYPLKRKVHQAIQSKGDRVGCLSNFIWIEGNEGLSTEQEIVETLSEQCTSVTILGDNIMQYDLKPLIREIYKKFKGNVLIQVIINGPEYSTNQLIDLFYEDIPVWTVLKCQLPAANDFSNICNVDEIRIEAGKDISDEDIKKLLDKAPYATAWISPSAENGCTVKDCLDLVHKFPNSLRTATIFSSIHCSEH